MRLFVAVWPPEGVVAALAALPRPEVPGVRWARPPQWHVTLRFLGELPGPEPVVAALAAPSAPARVATIGPAVVVLGRNVLAVPVAGLDDLAAEVVARTAALGEPPPARRFVGHLTVARAARAVDLRRSAPALAGAPVDGRWPVDAVSVVRSRLSPSGAEYEELARLPLPAAPG